MVVFIKLTLIFTHISIRVTFQGKVIQSVEEMQEGL